jgi:hypothetical protein
MKKITLCFTAPLILLVLSVGVLACKNDRVVKTSERAGSPVTDSSVAESPVTELHTTAPTVASPFVAGLPAAFTDSPSKRDGELDTALSAIADEERSNGFSRGMGIEESLLRERAGDYAGAVIAALKELMWTYAYSSAANAAVGIDAMVSSLKNVEDAKIAVNRNQPDVVQAVKASLAFLNKNYDEAGPLLNSVFASELEPDAFSSWMRLVCALEISNPQSDDGRRCRAEYKAIRARYQTLPLYWYYGARAFLGDEQSAWSERCINLAPDGPCAGEARAFIAVNSGLSTKDASAIRTRYEIDTTINSAIQTRTPATLAPLLPLAALKDNPYTIYAANALHSLAANDSSFKTWFAEEAKTARNKRDARLTERLNFIAGIRGETL